MVMFTPLSGYSDYVLLLIRLILGAVMLYYGLPKLKHPKANIKDMDKKGYRPGWLFSDINIAIEVLGGVGVIVGFFTWLAALGFGLQMLLGLIYKVTKTSKGFSDWSYDLILLGLCLIVLTFGAGPYRLY